MSTVIGAVPVKLDEATGEVYVDPADVEEMDYDDEEDESGLLWPFGKKARLRRTSRKIDRLERRQARLAPPPQEEPMPNQGAAPADVYQAAAAAGMIQENQYNGLGSVEIPASSTGYSDDTINRNLWGKSLVLDADVPAEVLVTGITVAGLPVNVGSKGTPLSMFASDSTRFGISFGRRLALTGQTFRVNLANIATGAPRTVSGGIIADELNPYAMQRWMEHMLLTAATQGFSAPGYGY